MYSDDKCIDLIEFLPTYILSGSNENKCELNIKSFDNYLSVSYISNHYNGSWKEHSLNFPRYLSEKIRTFEVLGLLQAEMGKTQNGTFSFANHEYRIINYIIEWFEKELELEPNTWRWSIKLNINEPENIEYKKQIEEKVITHWIKKSRVVLDTAYPKKVTYIKNTINKALKFYDYGTLVLEYRNNLFSQIIKTLVKKVTYEKILSYNHILIQSYMRGIIAGESTIEMNKKYKNYRVHITANVESERDIYYNCLSKLGIHLILYNNYKETIISKRENLVKLLKQRLMTLSPAKYAKFLYMMQQYPGIQEETGYFKDKGINVWNKIPQEKINEIIQFFNSGLTRIEDIANRLEISKIKVNRVLKENNLGKRVIKTSEEKRTEIAKFIKENANMTLQQIADHFNVHRNVVQRAKNKYHNVELISLSSSHK